MTSRANCSSERLASSIDSPGGRAQKNIRSHPVRSISACMPAGSSDPWKGYGPNPPLPKPQGALIPAVGIPNAVAGLIDAWMHSPEHRRPSLVRSPLRRPAQGHPRPIRRTMTVLLTIPVVALVGLWVYAAATTIGPYLASRNGQTDNRQLEAPSQAVLLQLTQERSDTLAWQSARGALPRTPLDAQRATTDAALSALRTGLAGAKGVGGAPADAAATTFENQLSQLPVIRAKVDAGQLTALAAFADYNNIVDVYFQYIRTQLVSDTSVPLYQQGEAVIASGQAVEMIGREAAVVGGALTAGGSMSAAEYRQFVQVQQQHEHPIA